MKPKTKPCDCGRIVYATPCAKCRDKERRAKAVKKTDMIDRLKQKITTLDRVIARLELDLIYERERADKVAQLMGINYKGR